MLKRFGIAVSYNLGILLFAVSVLCVPGSAQQTGITGRVTDPSNAVVASMIVTLTAEDGTKASTMTNTGGDYQFPGLRAGNYRLRFEAPGFAPSERTLTLLVGTTPTVDVTMTVSQTTSSVNVDAVANTVHTSNSSVAGDVSPTEVSKIPLNGRNYLQLAMMVPGITSNDVQLSPLGTTDTGKMEINVDGRQQVNTNFLTSIPFHGDLGGSIDRIPNHNEPIRRHHGSFRAPAGSGADQVSHERLPRSPVRLFPATALSTLRTR